MLKFLISKGSCLISVTLTTRFSVNQPLSQPWSSCLTSGDHKAGHKPSASKASNDWGEEQFVLPLRSRARGRVYRKGATSAFSGPGGSGIESKPPTGQAYVLPCLIFNIHSLAHFPPPQIQCFFLPKLSSVEPPSMSSHLTSSWLFIV